MAGPSGFSEPTDVRVLRGVSHVHPRQGHSVGQSIDVTSALGPDGASTPELALHIPMRSQNFYSEKNQSNSIKRQE
jgi:hypothetical protein